MTDSKNGSKIHCRSCGENIFHQSRVAIQCVVCNDVVLCPDCFAAKSDIGNHSPTHPYKLLDNGGFHLFHTEWTSGEHVKLLSAIEQYGYGNWEDIAKGINSEMDGSTCWRKRTPLEVKDEYCNIFLNGVMGRHTWKETERSKTKDHTQINPLLPPSPQNEPPPNLTFNESVVLGYFPKRDDFEQEFDNDGELLVSQLEDDTGSGNSNNLNEDDELIKTLNYTHVDMYRSKLRERERRKRVARDHGLINDYFKEYPVPGDRKSTGPNGQSSAKKKNQKDPVLEKLKILSEFQSVKEYQNFIAGIMKEKDVKARIKDLMRMRKNGITKQSDSIEFEVQRIRRNNRKKNEKRRQQQNAILGEAAAELNLTLAHSPISIKSEDLGTCGSAAQSPVTSSTFGVPNSPRHQEEKAQQISLLPGYDILSSNEKKLCANLRLTPAHYISYKTCLLTNHLQKKKGQTPKPLNPSGLDKNNRKIIFNFLMRAGWITAY